MKIVHTSDWHAGRIWKGKDRLDELEAVLAHLGDFCEEEAVDLLLMSGDVFDNGAPSARAERVVFRFFKRIGQAGIPSVVIAGNHDNSRRLTAWGELAEFVGVRAVGRPRPRSEGGIVEIETEGEERACIAAIPFAAARYFISAAELTGEASDVRRTYATALQKLIAHLEAGFRDDAVNLIMAHTHLQGAVLGGSERKVHIGENWAATPQSVGNRAHYVALGHIHKPQRVPAAPAPTHYAGSPLQLDFGEEGDEKSFCVVEAEAGRPARVERVPYEGGKPLRTIRKPLPELEAEADKLKEAGWLRVTVPLEQPDPDLNATVRRLLPNAVSVDVALPLIEEETESDRPPADAPPPKLFRDYYERRHSRAPSDELVATFESLLAECRGES